MQHQFADSAAAAQNSPSIQPNYLPARRVWERYGVTAMTIHRWLRDEATGFPKPIYIGRFRYWNIGALERWERETAIKRAAATSSKVA